MISPVPQNVDRAKVAGRIALLAHESVNGSEKSIRPGKAMNEINVYCDLIADITNVIDKITFQTALLAQRAAVETTRARAPDYDFGINELVVPIAIANLERSSVLRMVNTLMVHLDSMKEGQSSVCQEAAATCEEMLGEAARLQDTMLRLKVDRL